MNNAMKIAQICQCHTLLELKEQLYNIDAVSFSPFMSYLKQYQNTSCKHYKF